MSTTSKMVITGILAVLVVALSSGSYSITQVNAQTAEDEATSQRNLQIQDCQQLQARMANDTDAGSTI